MDDGLGQASAPLGAEVTTISTPAVWLRRSTNEAPAAARFNFWRQLPVGSHVLCPLGARTGFSAEFAVTSAPDGSAFAALGVDPCISRFGPGADDSLVDIGIVKGGSLHIRHGRDQASTLDAAVGPVLFDSSRPMTISNTRCELAYLRLPRGAVVAALGAAVKQQDAALRALPPGVLAHQLSACLRHLHYGSPATAAGVSATLRTARALALVALANLRDTGHHWEDGLEDALHVAAYHQLVQGLADPGLTVDTVARVLGCSRARLYRLFAAHGETIAGELRELRLRHAATLLRARPHVSVSAVAARCGYGEPVAFAKAFRRRFGLAPRTWQRLAV